MSQENVEVLEAGYAAIARGDLEAFLAVAHPEIEFRSLVAEAEGRTYKGHDGVREWWDSVIRSLGIRPGPEKIEAFRDRGITRMGLAGNIAGVEVPQRMWMAWRVRDGLLVWWATFRTEAEALEAVGLSDQDAHADT
jgi:ketosteroid isomerase-like protein